MNERLKKVFGEVFNLSAEEIPEDMSADKTSRWDSLTHLRLVMAIESEFGVRFETEDIPQLSSLKALRDKLSEMSVT